MTENEIKIKEIFKDEFIILIEKIEKDFVTNYNKKTNNFLLHHFDSNTIANMVFVSSFESKSGFTIEKCARKIANITYEVPPIIYSSQNIKGKKVVLENNISKHEPEKNQIIVTDIDIDNSDLTSKISKFNNDNKANNQKPSTLTQEKVKELLSIAENYKISDDNTKVKPVDLAFRDHSGILHIFELKLGGDLDSSNAPSNVEKLLKIYVGINDPNSKIYFATIYDKDKGKTWSGSIKKYLSFDDMCLIGEKFWEKILPPDVNYNKLIELYEEALKEINLNSSIQTLIKNVTVEN
jgi:hypothetical protein